MNALKQLMTSGGSARIRVVAAAGLLVVAVAAVAAYRHFGSRVSTDDAQVDAHIAPIGAKVSGNISEILVADNQVVKAGQVLLRIDPRDYQARLDQACAQLSAAESQGRGADAGVPLTNATTASVTVAAGAQLAAATADHARAAADYDRASSSELAAATADVEAKRATADRSRADLERMTPLADKHEISGQQFDAYRATERVALSELTVAEQKVANALKQADSSKAVMVASQARIEAARAVLAQATANRRQVEISTAQAGSASAAIQQARAAVTAAYLQLSYTTVLAPIDGIVTKKTIQLGQIIQSGQSLMTIVPLSDVWVTANFKETQLAEVRPSQRAEIHVDTYGRSFEGHVDSIAAATGAKLSLLPPENATGNFVKIVQRIPVKIALDRVEEGYTFRPGMNVDVTIFTK
ncbi:MAG: HlyD family secretion protein [Acidobacteriota bacterium]